MELSDTYRSSDCFSVSPAPISFSAFLTSVLISSRAVVLLSWFLFPKRFKSPWSPRAPLFLIRLYTLYSALPYPGGKQGDWSWATGSIGRNRLRRHQPGAAAFGLSRWVRWCDNPDTAIRTIHVVKDVRTTMVYTYVLNRGGKECSAWPTSSDPSLQA